MEIELQRSTGDRRIDEILRGGLGVLNALVPGRVRSAYLTGSLASGTAVVGSDIDLLVVVKGSLSKDDTAIIRDFAVDGSRLAGRFLDIAPVDEASLFTEGRTSAKKSSYVLIWGDETRDRWATESVAEHLHKPMRGTYFYLRHFRGSKGPLTYPLAYPNPDGEFLGYERHGYRDLEGWTSPGTKALVGAMTLAASVIVAMQTGQMPATKSQSRAAYRGLIGDEWTAWLEALSDACRGEWGYRVPEEPSDRGRLRELCALALNFENYYLSLCHNHLLAGLRGSDEAEQARSLDTLFRLRYPDPEIAEAIGALIGSPNDKVRELAMRLDLGERHDTKRWQ